MKLAQNLLANAENGICWLRKSMDDMKKAKQT